MPKRAASDRCRAQALAYLDVVHPVILPSAQVACAGPETCERVALGELTRTVSQLRAACDALDARIARRASELAAAGESEPAAALFDRVGHRSASESRAAVRCSEVCTRHHGLAEALGAGEVSGGHLDAVARARHGLDPAAEALFDTAVDALVEDAKRCGSRRSPAAAAVSPAAPPPTPGSPATSGCAASAV
jgi:hypothetical protein